MSYRLSGHNWTDSIERDERERIHYNWDQFKELRAKINAPSDQQIERESNHDNNDVDEEAIR